ncbi:MAG: Pycsar system effector family protein [Ferruginibacter sp.]
MNVEQKINKAELNLQRKLDWVSKHDTRVAFTTSIVIAMLGVLVNASAAIKSWEWYIYIFFGLSLALLFACLVLIYMSQFPKTTSVNTSLIFFGTVASMKFDEFKKRFIASTEDDYLDDLLSQTHKNAEILCKKFKYLKATLVLILISVIPWLLTIYYSKIFIKNV